MEVQNRLIEIINNAIKDISYPSVAPGLFDPIKYTLSVGGKRIRPLLTLMSTSLFTEDINPAISPAIGIEVFHNFTLLHDDLMDNALIRRKQPTVHVKWDANTAILSGDAMQILAYKLVAASPSEHLKQVIDLFSKTALEICEGQQFDMEFESREDVPEGEYIEMIRLKTAVLLGCALKVGAIIGGAENKDADLLYTFGEKIGLAFQLKDDLLDVYGDPKVFGKNIGGDILNNKKTFLLIKALELSSEKDNRQIRGKLKEVNFSAEEKIEFFTSVYNNSGAKNECGKRMEEYFNMGLKALKRVNIETEKKYELEKLASQLMYRES
ncbi:MAG: polyprenyl synthetase family protein [Bacteroidales bacterium]|nr:polyprenyl synthetase family protein [Bacteroidales bacterium]